MKKILVFLTAVFLAALYLTIGYVVLTHFNDSEPPFFVAVACLANFLISALCGGIGEVCTREGDFFAGAAKYGLVFPILLDIALGALVGVIVTTVFCFLCAIFGQLHPAIDALYVRLEEMPVIEQVVCGYFIVMWMTAWTGLWGEKSDDDGDLDPPDLWYEWRNQ